MLNYIDLTYFLVCAVLSLIICILGNTTRGQTVLQNLCQKLKFNAAQTNAVIESLKYHLWVWGLAVIMALVTAFMILTDNIWHLMRSDTWEFMGFITICCISFLRGMLIGWTITIFFIYVFIARKQ